jgi:hypothetical protein
MWRWVHRSPVSAAFFMEHFEGNALETARHKPVCCFRYVGDKFVIWSHGPGKLADFLDSLHSIHQNIQFTMETERNGYLHFPDIGK